MQRHKSHWQQVAEAFDGYNPGGYCYLDGYQKIAVYPHSVLERWPDALARLRDLSTKLDYGIHVIEVDYSA